MRYLARQTANRGTNLMEVTITAVIAGILAAVAVPSLMGILQGSKVDQGLVQVQNSLKDAQKQAMRLGQSCEVTFNTTANPPTITASPAGCLVGTDTELPTGIVLESNAPGDKISFSFKGTTTSSGTMVVKSADGQGEQKCLVISIGIGIMRTGTYNSRSNNISSDDCVGSS